jgi:hypothetical protein
LLTYRELAQKSVARQEAGEAGVLRSAALRGVHAARQLLRLSYAAASSRDAESAAVALPLLRLTVKNYATLLLTLWRTADNEAKSGADSAWLSFFVPGQNDAYLAHETSWISRFFEAAAREGFSLDTARSFMREGAVFYAEANSFHAAPILPVHSLS